MPSLNPGGQRAQQSSPSQPRQLPPIANAVEKGTKTCPSCGETLKKSAVKCGACGETFAEKPVSATGARLSPEPERPSPAGVRLSAKTEKRSTSLLVKILIGLFAVPALSCVGCFVLAAISGGGESQSQSQSPEYVEKEKADPDEEAEWSKAEEAHANLPFLQGTEATTRFLAMFPDGVHSDKARERIALGIEMDWSAQVFLKLLKIQGNQTIAEKYRRLATQDIANRKNYFGKSNELLEEAVSLINDLQQMGYAGSLDMLPNKKSNHTEIVLFYRKLRFPGKYSDWEEKRQREILQKINLGNDASPFRPRIADPR
jgi:hypothetical protein